MLRLHPFRRMGLAVLLTLHALGQTLPVIRSTEPENGSKDVPPGQPVVLTFSVPMNTSVTTVQFINSSVPPPNTLNVVRTWSADGTRLTNTPIPPFPAGKAIVWFATGMDTQGHPLGIPSTGGFVTADGGGPTPSLLSVSPGNQAGEVPTQAVVVFTFSVAMNTNRTTAEFQSLTDPAQTVPVSVSWNDAQTVMSCTPVTAFPTGAVIVWNLQGEGAEGGAFSGAFGGFTTVSNGGVSQGGSALVSRGEYRTQTDAAAPQPGGLEFLALADTPAPDGLAVVTPSAATPTLAAAAGTEHLQHVSRMTDSAAFALSFPPGDYQFRLSGTNGTSTGTVPLADGPLPGVPQLAPWPPPPRAVLGQALVLQWTFDGASDPADHLRLQIRQGGRVLFASPLPDSPGALTGASNLVVVPAGTFAEPGTAEVTLSAFRYLTVETNAVPGWTLRSARHRTTRFSLRIADGNTPPPALTSGRFPGIPVGTPVLYTLRTTNGVRPIRFERIAGTVPPGLVLGSDGTLTGTATAPGTHDLVLRLTDLLGRSTTETVQLVTAPLPAFPTPHLDNIRYDGSGSVRFDIVGGRNLDCRIERSGNLAGWSTHLQTNPPSDTLSIEVPVTEDASFFRVLGPGARPPSNPLRVTPVARPGASVSGLIGMWGGTLAYTNASGWVYSLNVPAGALDGTEQITLSELGRVDGLPLAGGLRAAVALSPGGLLFRTPVDLKITAPDTVSPMTDVGFQSLADGREFALSPYQLSEGAASFRLLYLAVVGLGRGTWSDVQSQRSHAPDDALLAAHQEAAAIQMACALGHCDAVLPGGTGVLLSASGRIRRLGEPSGREHMIAVYVATAKQVILPQLQTASESEDDTALDNALLAWFRWVKDLQTLGLASDPMGQDQEGELAACMQSAAGLAARGIWNGMTRSCQQCLEHDLSRIGRTESLARTAASLGWGFDTYYFECAQRCLVFEVSAESLMTSSGTSGTYLTDTKFKIELRPYEDDWHNVLFSGGYKGDGMWEVKNVQDFDSRCPVTNSPKNGEASVPMARLRLFQQRCDYIPNQGLVVRNTYFPDLRIYLLANRDKLPKEGRTSRCPKEDPKDVPNVFGPAFLAFHASTTETPETIGEPCVRLEGFEQLGSGEVLFRKEYIQSQVVTDGYVEERTTVELIHKPN